MNWIKWLTDKFNSQTYDNVGDVGEAVQEKARDISEPVLSFVECVRNNRKRFTVRDIQWGYDKRYEWEVIDKLTGQVFNAKYCFDSFRRNYGAIVQYYWKDYPEWLTTDELDYIRQELTSIYSKYRERINLRRSIMRDRYNRDSELRKSKERERLKGIYCQEEK